MIRLRSLSLVLLAALPLGAQLGYGPSGAEGLRLRVRVAGEEWGPELANGKSRLQGGRVGSGRAVDGLALSHAKVPLRVEIATAKGWSGPLEAGKRSGTAGEPITGIRVKAEGRSIRYRASFVGKGIGAWARDGAPAEAGGAPLEALDVELLEAAPADTAGFEYRVLFAGSGFTLWKRPGEPAEGSGPEPKATAIEVRGADLKTEVRLAGGGWMPTAAPGEVAGDASGKQGLAALRVFSPEVPLRYRLKIEGSGWAGWHDSGQEAGTPSSGLRVEGILLDWKRSTR